MQYDLHKTFQVISTAFPQHIGSAVPLAVGNEGLVIDHADGTVSKFFMCDRLHNREKA